MSLQDRIEKFLYGQVMWSGQAADPKREAATIAAMLLDLLRKGPWFDEAVERMTGVALMTAGLEGTKYGDTHMVEHTRTKMARLLRAALGEEP